MVGFNLRPPWKSVAARCFDPRSGSPGARSPQEPWCCCTPLHFPVVGGLALAEPRGGLVGTAGWLGVDSLCAVFSFATQRRGASVAISAKWRICAGRLWPSRRESSPETRWIDAETPSGAAHGAPAVVSRARPASALLSGGSVCGCGCFSALFPSSGLLVFHILAGFPLVALTWLVCLNKFLNMPN